nr:alpha/beta hydrolase fold protein [Tanacetum cinerariifolium]
DTVAVADDKMGEKNWQNGNWMFKVLQVRSLWKANENNNYGEHHLGNEDSTDQYYDTCRVDADDEDVKVKFDKDLYSKLLWTVSIADARLYAQMPLSIQPCITERNGPKQFRI